MSYGKTIVSVGILMCMLVVGCMVGEALSKVPEGFRDIRLGMQKSQVLDVLQKNPRHFSYDDMGAQIGEVVRGDDLFRYATYRFDEQGILFEIKLQMREILGRDRVLEVFNAQHNLRLGSVPRFVESGFSIELQENSLIIKIVPSREAHAAKGAQ